MKANPFIAMTERFASYCELAAIALILIFAFLFQFMFEELPCPLCLLQRFGFMCMAVGLLLNLRFGFRPSHYALVILSGLFTCFVALRQIALHVIPGTGAYGSALFGLHLYTWSFIAAMMVTASTTILLGADRQYGNGLLKNQRWRWLINAIFAFMVFLIVANIVSVLAECGFSYCPDNPTSYSLV